MQSYEIAAKEVAFSSFPRNIRVQLDGTSAVIDLIPSVVLEKSPDVIQQDPIPVLNEMLARSKPIVEGDFFMRVHFDWIHALVIQEEFIELVDVCDLDLKNAPRMTPGDDRAIYPFLRVLNSEWKSNLADYEGGDDLQLDHFKMFSMETHIDVIGDIQNIEWLANK